MIIETVVVGALQVNCYVLSCEQTHQAAVIDPGDDADAILRAVRRHNLDLASIFVTHGHFDHVQAARPLQEATGARLYMHPADRPLLEAMRETAFGWLGSDPGAPPRIDVELDAGSTVQVGVSALEVRLTPGHSPGGVSFVDPGGRRVFTGDALFAGSIGRTDLEGGNLEDLLAGIHTQIMTLPDDYAVLPGHGPASSVGRERRTNPFLEPDAFDVWS